MKLDTAGQIDIINQMIIAKVDALVIAPADLKALVSAIKRPVIAALWWSISITS